MSGDIGAILEGETSQIRDGILENPDAYVLNVHGDLYRLPKDWNKVSPEEVLRQHGLHEKIGDAVMNDGNNPRQIQLLLANYLNYYDAREAALKVADCWTGDGRPQAPDKHYPAAMSWG